MPRTIRSASTADTYHVIIRGSGKQIIFEDDDQRVLFLRLADRYVKELEGEVYAWILMSDHVHLVLHMPLEVISTLMQKLGATYFRNFNDNAGRSGPVLQGRFHSEPINTDPYLMTCVRYVHQNIEKAGAGTMETCWWSSYGDYVGAGLGQCYLETRTDFVLAVFDGIDGFLTFHAVRDFAVPCIDIGKTTVRMTDDEALIFARSLIGEERLSRIRQLEISERNSALRQLKETKGMSIRQIGRLTGLGENVVRRA